VSYVTTLQYVDATTGEPVQVGGDDSTVTFTLAITDTEAVTAGDALKASAGLSASVMCGSPAVQCSWLGVDGEWTSDGCEPGVFVESPPNNVQCTCSGAGDTFALTVPVGPAPGCEEQTREQTMLWNVFAAGYGLVFVGAFLTLSKAIRAHLGQVAQALVLESALLSTLALMRSVLSLFLAGVQGQVDLHTLTTFALVPSALTLALLTVLLHSWVTKYRVLQLASGETPSKYHATAGFVGGAVLFVAPQGLLFTAVTGASLMAGVVQCLAGAVIAVGLGLVAFRLHALVSHTYFGWKKKMVPPIAVAAFAQAVLLVLSASAGRGQGVTTVHVAFGLDLACVLLVALLCVLHLRALLQAHARSRKENSVSSVSSVSDRGSVSSGKRRLSLVQKEGATKPTSRVGWASEPSISRKQVDLALLQKQPSRAGVITPMGAPRTITFDMVPQHTVDLMHAEARMNQQSTQAREEFERAKQNKHRAKQPLSAKNRTTTIDLVHAEAVMHRQTTEAREDFEREKQSTRLQARLKTRQEKRDATRGVAPVNEDDDDELVFGLNPPAKSDAPMNPMEAEMAAHRANLSQDAKSAAVQAKQSGLFASPVAGFWPSKPSPFGKVAPIQLTQALGSAGKRRAALLINRGSSPDGGAQSDDEEEVTFG
jgi:hypothetical protein